jgi:hypothetical protein
MPSVYKQPQVTSPVERNSMQGAEGWSTGYLQSPL